METITLASTSPQRQAILQQLHIPFIVAAPQTEEAFDDNLSPQKNVEHIAMKKAGAAVNMPTVPSTRYLIAADTLVFLHGKPIGKPPTACEARKLLQSYSNTAHTVISAICCYTAERQRFSTITSLSHVFFKPLTGREIDWYLSLGEWRNAAGGYRIQGAAACLISRIEGSYSGIMGLPIYELYAILTQEGYHFHS